MKKSAVFFLITILTFIFGLTSVQAAGVTKLKAGITYTLDLNGGTKERVNVKMTSGTYANGRYVGAVWHMYVNEREVARYSFSKTFEEDIEVYYVDLNKKDKYKEVFVMSTGVNSCLADARAVRYYSDKKVKVLPLINYSKRMRLLSCNGKKKMSFWADTPFYNYKFGCYYCKVTGKVKGDKIIIQKQKTYKLETPNGGLLYQGNRYELNQSMKLYRSASNKKAYRLLKPGTRFVAQKIKPARSKVENGIRHWDVYVKIKTTKGKKGWLFFSNSAVGQYLKYTPGWG